MRIGELVNTSGRWVRWDNPDDVGFVELEITPKSGGLEKAIARKSVTTKMGKKGRMEVQSNPRLALKMLIEGCLHGIRGVENEDGSAYEFTPDNAFNLLWNGPAGLMEFFEDQVGQVTEETEEGNV